MGMTKQDLTRRLRCMKAIYHDPPTPEVVLSDEEETLSRPSFKAAASSGDFTDSNKEMSLIRSDLTLAKEEVTRLVVEVERLQAFKQKLEESGKQVADLEATIRQMEEEVAEKERSWRALEERLANEATSTYGLGFEAALEQVQLLCPSADVFGADVGKVVIDGQIVED
ncbi:hypothetical protein DEO72_LG10g3421 [Vigna unguiculata]|uniref:Uncharacterized protein n=1 Tax=Vigna unguiculata TaxID=3917 RepID=A0A4D6NEC9_VIGUN|nr:hypothetical protein DEO72_LG10g3421 [Vigna unguiculata]